MNRSSPTEHDAHFGERLKDARRRRNPSQGTVAKALGASTHQVQKYESGVNRVAAGRLDALAKVLGVEVRWLLGDEDLPDDEMRLLIAFRSLPDVNARIMIHAAVEAAARASPA